MCENNILARKHLAAPPLPPSKSNGRFLTQSGDDIVERDTKIVQYLMSRDARKPVFGVSEQVRHTPACTVTEAG